MNKMTTKKINYMVACVFELARRYQVTTRAAFLCLYQYQGLQFLDEFYDIEHTLSIEDVLDDLENICHQNGGKLQGGSITPCENGVIDKMNQHEWSAECITHDIVSCIMMGDGVDTITAMCRFFTSATHEKLMDEKNGLHRESVECVYSMYVAECGQY